MAKKKFRIPLNSNKPLIARVIAIVSAFWFTIIMGLSGVGRILVICGLPLMISAILFAVLTSSKSKQNIIVSTIFAVLGCYSLLFFLFYPFRYLFGFADFLLSVFIISSYVTFTLTITSKITSKIPSIVAIGVTIAIVFLNIIADFFYFRSIIYYLSFIGIFLAMLLIILALTDKEVTKEDKDYAFSKQLGGFQIGENFKYTTYPELYKNKNIAVYIILSIITFGIYGMIWQYSLCKKIKLLNNDNTSCVGEFLCLILVPFYSLYWVYTRAKNLSDGAKMRGMTIKDNGVMYLGFVLFGVGIIAFAMIQNDLNIIATQLCMGATQVTNYQTQTDTPQVPDNFNKLKQLSELHIQGILTDEEYEVKKKVLLDRI